MGLKLQQFAQALASLEALLGLIGEPLRVELGPVLFDAVQNGVAQKYEVVVELGWKATKEALREHAGLEVASPKGCLKEALLQGWLDEEAYMTLFEAVDQRNVLSHLYDEAAFTRALATLPRFVGALHLLREVLGRLD
jgi:nucleotidyltransferase substrate binding protein (TIGR01987 family)